MQGARSWSLRTGTNLASGYNKFRQFTAAATPFLVKANKYIEDVQSRVENEPSFSPKQKGHVRDITSRLRDLTSRSGKLINKTDLIADILLTPQSTLRTYT